MNNNKITVNNIQISIVQTNAAGLPTFTLSVSEYI